MNESYNLVKDGRYMLFANDTYYPAGGMGDYQFSFDSKDQFDCLFEKLCSYDEYHLFDVETKIYFFVTVEYLRKWVDKL